VIADTAQRWPYMEDLTADIIYVRLHGEIELYTSGYDDEALDRWAQQLKKWRDGSASKTRTVMHRWPSRSSIVTFRKAAGNSRSPAPC
jgi:uncharacterized protein YecE (DUF72 family)